MPPTGNSKRKRSDRTFSEDNLSRPSPHRPGNLDLARHQSPHSPSYSRDEQAYRGRPGRRASRGGRGAANNSSPIAVPVVATLIAQTTSPADSININNMASTSEVKMQNGEPEDRSQPRPYNYTYLTDETVSNWNTTGRDQIKIQLAEIAQDRNDIQLDILIQELVEASTTGQISAIEAGEIIKEVGNSESDIEHEIQITLIGAISILFVEDSPNPNINPLADLLSSSGIEDEILRNELDGKLLEQLGLIRSTFYRVGIRKQTNVLYRQANFNLMREESEGFAKLLTELFTTSGNELPTGEVVENTVEKVKAMIGAFDLDVGRSLDTVLDVFGAVLVKQYRFFVKFLRASPWWPRRENDQTVADAMNVVGGLPAWALPGVSGWQSTEEEKVALQDASHNHDVNFWPKARSIGLKAFQQLGHTVASAKMQELAQNSEEDNLEFKWIRETGTIPKSGNRDAAQLLGFKLRFYSSSSARDPIDILPDHLIYLSALLIKIGFISLYDLYPHIWRLDEDMEALKEIKMKEKMEREKAARPGAGAKNALLMAGALADDTLPVPPRLRDTITRAGTPSKDTENDKPVKDPALETPDQKVLLLKSLLAVGALPEALFILGRFPWIVDLFPEMPEYIHRILHHCLSKVYEDLRPLRSRESLHVGQPAYETDLPGLQKGQVNIIDNPRRKVLRWALLDKDDSNDGTDYRFYWDEWNDSIPVCQSVDDVFTMCKTLLPLVGVKIGQDPLLVLKFTRIGKRSLSDDNSNQNYSRWLDLSKRILLPSLSLTKSNPGVINEVFELISLFPTNTRYMMYLEWLNGRTSRNGDLKAAFDQAKAETRDILKRISKTNVKPMARSLAKIAYANPHIVITTALTQIEVYDSIAEVFVEGARYFTDLGYDVLTWALISSMGRAGRNRVQEDGLFTSKWLTALASFAGKIYKRYNLMKPGPVLQYVAVQLENGSSTDLIMLEQMIVSMAGIAPDTNFNDAQLQAMGGGQLLQSQTILQLLDQRHASKTTSKRLIKALQDHDLSAKLLILMAQQRQACVFEQVDVPLKAIGNTFDEINRVVGQYLDLLRTGLTTDEFESTIPDVGQLLIDYDLPAEIAFWISRPVLARRIIEADKESHDIQKETVKNGDTEMMDQDLDEEDGEAVEIEEVATTMATPTENEITGSIELESTEQLPFDQERWHPVLKPIIEKVESQLPSEIVDVVGAGFYVTFWQLSLYEISVPGKSYEDEMGRQKKKIAAITSDRSNVSVSSTKAREAQVKQIQQIIDDLLAENKQHLKAYGESRARLQQEKDHWFATKARISEHLNIALMEHCFLPRILSSPLDAYFCFKFVKFLHSNGTPNFRTVGFYDLFLRPERLASLIFMCTSKESDNFGRFLNEILKDLARWHKDKAVFEREACGSKKNLPGFALKIENGKPQLFLDFESFRRLLFKWHSNLYSALIKCLSSTEYMHVRNAISILRAISAVYPAVNFHGTTLQKSVDKLRDSDREDLKVASQALLGALHRREKEWIIPQAFRQGQDRSTEEEKSATKMIDKVEIEHPSKVDDEDETGEVKMTDVASKTEFKESDANLKALPTERHRSISRASANRTPISTRPNSEAGFNERRRLVDSNKSHDLPRKVSPPPARYSTPNLPSRPEAESRNGYRDGRIPTRPPLSEPVHPESRSYTRHGPIPETQYDHQQRYSRGHERPPLPDRDERGSRRELERPGHEDRRTIERDLRPDRDLRLNSDHNRPRDYHNADRDHARLNDHTDRRRPDIISDDHRSDSGAPGRSTPQASTASINPERAALINNAPDSRPGMSIRGQAQDKGRSSRASSPKRDEEKRHTSRHEREDRRSDPVVRPSGLIPSEVASQPRTHMREQRQAYDVRSVDMQHGRLEQDGAHRPPTRNDRPTDGEPPSGPRNRPVGSGSRGRGASTSLVQNDRPTPTGPARHGRNSSIQEPQTIETGGVHPDRLNLVSPSEPSRNQRPPPLQTSPPAGPRGNAPPSAPSGPSPSTRGPPSGPASGLQGDGAGRGRRHPMAAVNNTLAQAAQGPSSAGRGRGASRQNSTTFNGHMHSTSGSREISSQQDISSVNPNGMPVQPRPGSNRPDNGMDNERRPPRMRTDDRDGPRGDKDGKDDRRTDESRRNNRREDTRNEQRGYRTGPNDEMQSRKHPRDEGQPYGGPSRGGGRIGSETKRPRRGA